ncbi:MAG: metal-dependent transcriptional regulator [Cuniculiplasma sp.]
MTAQLSITTEDYLKSIYELTEYKGFASLTDISQILGTARQTVYDEIKILLERKFIKRSERGKYTLSRAGEREANKFLRKHRVSEILLWKGLNMQWSKLDDQAMGIEHGMTEQIISAVCKQFGCKKCPHGNPIPSVEGIVEEIPDLKFSELEIDRVYYISRVVFETPEILNFLETNSLLPETKIKKTLSNELVILTHNSTVNIPPHIINAIRFLDHNQKS